MSAWPPRLRTRLFLSYLVVVLAGAIAMFVVGTVVTRTVYERRLGGFGFGGTGSQGRSQGAGGGASPVTESQLRTALDESLMPAMLIGAAAAIVAAAIVAWFVGRRLLRPLDEVRAAARRMAAGDYAATVPVPAETELAMLAHDVNALGEHLATTEQRRTQLLGEVTHELRTPITVIRGQMEGLLDGVVAPSDEVFVAVADEAARVQRLVDDLALLSRAEEGSLQIEHAEVELAEVAAAAAERLRPQFEHARVDLVVAPADRPVRVLGDRDRLTQVLTNVLGNALAHTPEGGSVTVRTGHHGGEAWVEVVDTGSGIAPDELDHVFERFYRGADAGVPGRTSRAGRGIGLTIARGLARAHGGDVTASSRGPGTGATFRMTLPG